MSQPKAIHEVTSIVERCVPLYLSGLEVLHHGTIRMPDVARSTLRMLRGLIRIDGIESIGLTFHRAPNP